MMFLLESSWRHVHQFYNVDFFQKHLTLGINRQKYQMMSKGCPITSKTHRSLGSMKPFSDEPGSLGLESPRTLFDRMELTTESHSGWIRRSLIQLFNHMDVAGSEIQL